MLMRRIILPGTCLFIASIFIGATALGAEIELPFSENWNAETPGDNVSQLTDWSLESAYGSAPAGEGTIVAVGGGDNVLNLNPAGSDSIGICSEATGFGEALLTVESDIQLTGDGAGAGVLGFCRKTAALDGYVLAVSRDGSGGAWLDLRKFDGSLDDSFTVGPVQITNLDPTVRHAYRLEAAFAGGQIDFSVYVDNTLRTETNLSPTDTDPHDFSDGVRFVLASNYGQQAYFDDFQAIPEPCTLTLLGLSGAALLRRRR